GFRDSTSLEQVADWLTKIIVGLTLTQYSAWEQKFDNLSRNLTEGLLGPAPLPQLCETLLRGTAPAARAAVRASDACATSPAAAVPGGLILALYAIAGFLISYLWMRRYFILEMVIARREARAALNDLVIEAERRQAEATSMVQKARKEAEQHVVEKDAVTLRARVEEEERARQAALDQGRAQTTVALTEIPD